MSFSKIEPILELDDTQLENEIVQALKALLQLRLKKSTRVSFPPHSFRHVKHRLGQLRMVQRQRELTNQNTSKERG